jgi:hypothetical protein
VRRSLVELTEAARLAAGDGMLVMPIFPIAAAVADALRPEDAANKPAVVPRQARSPDAATTAEMLAQIAKDHQARALEGIRLGLSAALDYAKDFARTPMPADLSSPDSGTKSEDKLLAAVGAAATHRTEAIELVKAQAAATLEYARDLAGARTAADFVELSSELARKQCELMLKQAAVLQSFAQGLTKADDRDDEISQP